MEPLLPVVELFKKSFDVYLKKVWTLAGLALFSFLGLVIILPFVIAALAISYGPFSRQEFNINLILVDILLVLVGIFLAIIPGLWSQAAMFFAAREDGVNFKKSLSIAWPKIGSFFWVSLLVGLAVLGGFILFFIPGVIFCVWFCLSIFVFVSEDLKGTAALKRSKQLVKGYWWPVFGRILLIALVSIVISLLKPIGPIVNIFFTGPFVVIFEYMLYQDLKRAKQA